MRSLLIAGLAGALAMVPQSAVAATDSDTLQSDMVAPVDISFASPAAIAASVDGAKTRMPKMGGHMGKRMGNRMGGGKMHRMKTGGHKMRTGGHRMKMRGHHNRGGNRWGKKMNGRWNGGMRAPGGYGGYTHPRRGYRLPSYWVQPSFFIGNYSTYGFSQPTAGYGWSRYYDDAVLTDQRGVIYDSVQNVDWDRYEQGYNNGYQSGYGSGYNQGQASYDNRVLMSDTRVIAPGAPAYAGGTTYQGDWDGQYRADGSYEGDWEGTYRDADGRVYEGEYSGTFIGDGNSAPVTSGADYANGGSHWGNYGGDYDRGSHGYVRGDYDRNEELAYLARCRKSSGIGGAVVGGAIGALAGNRIAGRGNRLGGSLIGGGVGAVAGAAIEQGTDRCRKLLKKYGERPQYRAQARSQYRPQYRTATPQYRAPVQQQRAYPTGWQGGYAQQGYYYPQTQPMVTTVTVQPSAATTTTTTTTYIDEEVTYAAPRVKSKKLYKPAAKRVWKPAPRRAQEPLKGCQQAHC